MHIEMARRCALLSNAAAPFDVCFNVNNTTSATSHRSSSDVLDESATSYSAQVDAKKTDGRPQQRT